MIRGETSEHWEERFEQFGVPVSKVYFVQELLEHPQVKANGYAVDVEHDLAGPATMVSPAWKMSASPPAAQGASPPLGRDTDAILSSVGYSAEEIEAMRGEGAIR
ncbi:MAG: hypothetical protein GEU80_10095 [Dehalococcoidia bacterium]|nr:hypothetical protein [Dehalococcoidia bacterium]